MVRISVARQKTAIHRSQVSRPIRIAIQDGLINHTTSVFDYGCGYGDDIRHLKSQGFTCLGWDPAHRPNSEISHSDIVNLGYVVNVIESSTERVAALQNAWDLAQKLLIVSARLSVEVIAEAHTPYEDGFITRSTTFQKFYEQHELRAWIDSNLGVSSIPAAPGIFYVFRDETLRQAFISSRYRRRATAPRQRRSDVLFERYRDLLGPLIEFVSARGRLPDLTEWDLATDVIREVGSLRRAFSIIRRVTSPAHWEKIREDRSQDLLVYLALARFGKRPRLSQLPRELQLDIRAFFSTYNRACSIADELLFSAGKPENIDNACRSSDVGKLTPNALYVHVSALSSLAPVLRVYEGCARTYIGAVDGANVVKLFRAIPQISYLSYPEFEKNAHPSLAASLVVPLQTFRIRYREYEHSNNPPILHRKEQFLGAGHPLREKFSRLTKQEELQGLYQDTQTIGTRNGWLTALSERGLQVCGHRVLKIK